MSETPANRVLATTAILRDQLLAHPVYTTILDVDSLRIFMQHHAFAVLDFMWLLKRLQRDICCNDVPWLPPANADLSRFVNEIVLGEESDENGMGGYCSHFEMYLQAMSDVDADQTQIRTFVALLREGRSVSSALNEVAAPESVRRFVEFTHQIATTGSTAEVACVFCFGREDIIPEMFQRLLTSFTESGMTIPRLAYYIRRHIELDGDHHGPLTRKMVNVLCDSEAATTKAISTAQDAIQHRIALWDGVLSSLGEARGIRK
jgi:hypothetical protein